MKKIICCLLIVSMSACLIGACQHQKNTPSVSQPTVNSQTESSSADSSLTESSSADSSSTESSSADSSLSESSSAKQDPLYRQVTQEEAAQMMQTEKDYIILDVRTQSEYNDGHIPKAICIPNETIDTQEIPLLPDKSQLILVYCRSGRRSKEAAEKLAKIGYTNIVEFGGIITWTGEIEQ